MQHANFRSTRKEERKRKHATVKEHQLTVTTMQDEEVAPGQKRPGNVGEKPPNTETDNVEHCVGIEDRNGDETNHVYGNCSNKLGGGGFTVKLPKPSTGASQLPKPSSKELEAVVDKLQKRDVYLIFAEPVTEDVAPGYFSIIKKPMDFKCIREKVRNGRYQSFDELWIDVELMLNNAMTYNEPHTIFYKEAYALLAVSRKIVEQAKRRWQRKVVAKIAATGDERVKLPQGWDTPVPSGSVPIDDEDKAEDTSAPVKLSVKAAAANEIKERLAEVEHVNKNVHLKKKQRNLGALQGGANAEGVPFVDKTCSMVPQRFALPIDGYARSICRFAARLHGRARELCLARAVPFLPWERSGHNMFGESTQTLPGRLHIPSTSNRPTKKETNDPISVFSQPLVGVRLAEETMSASKSTEDHSSAPGSMGTASQEATHTETETCKDTTEKKVASTPPTSETAVPGHKPPGVTATARPVTSAGLLEKKQQWNGALGNTTSSTAVSHKTPVNHLQGNFGMAPKRPGTEEKRKAASSSPADVKPSLFHKQHNHGRSSAHLLVQQLQPNLPFKLQPSMNLKTEESKRAVLAAVQKLQAYQSGMLQGQGQKK